MREIRQRTMIQHLGYFQMITISNLEKGVMKKVQVITHGWVKGAQCHLALTKMILGIFQD